MLSLTATSCFLFSGSGRCLSSEQLRSLPVWAGMYWTCTAPSANSSTYILEIQVHAVDFPALLLVWSFLSYLSGLCILPVVSIMAANVLIMGLDLCV